MASKDIDQFLKEVAEQGIDVCERTVRRKLNAIEKSPKDLKEPFVRSFIIALLSPNTDKLLFEMYLEALARHKDKFCPSGLLKGV